MNEPTNPDAETFESQLRRLVPQAQQELIDRTEETFYLAGWAAAEKHFGTHISSQSPARSQITTPSTTTAPSTSGSDATNTNQRKSFQAWRDKTLTFSSGLAAGLLIWVCVNTFAPPQPSETAQNQNPSTEIPSSESANRTTYAQLPKAVESERLDDRRILGSMDLDSAIRPALSRAALLHWKTASASRQFSQVPTDQSPASPTAKNILRSSPMDRDEFTDFL